MKINFFEDTDTAQIEFTSKAVVETREVSENVYLDLDENGNLVSMTIEHAEGKSQHPGFCFRAATQSERMIHQGTSIPPSDNPLLAANVRIKTILLFG